MSLKDRITEDMKAAMRAKDAPRLSTIRLLLAAIKQKEIDERISVDDPQAIAIVDKLIKQRKDSVSAFQQAGRIDLADKEQAEIGVLEGYLPQRLGGEQIAAEVARIVAALADELGRKPAPADIGKVMAQAKAQLGGKVDMGQVSAAVKSALAQ